MTFLRYAGLSLMSFFEFIVFLGLSITYLFLIISRLADDNHYIFFILGIFQAVVTFLLLLNILTFGIAHKDIQVLLGPAAYMIILQTIAALIYGWPRHEKVLQMQTVQPVSPDPGVANVGNQATSQPIGDFLKDKRTKAGFTQQQLAEAIPVSRQTIHRWESGKSHPDMEYMIRVAEILSFSVTEFWGNDEQAVNTEIGNVVRKRNAYRQALYFLLTLILVSFTVSAVAFLGRNIQSPYLDRVNPFMQERTGYAMVSSSGKQKAIVFDNDSGQGNIITLNGYSKKTEFVKIIHKGSYVKSEVRNLHRSEVPTRVRNNLYYASHFDSVYQGLEEVQKSYQKRDV